MPAINDIPLDQIAFSDLERLKENEIEESRTLEYKSQLPGDTPDDKKEFLKDVSAFANTVGGDLLYGIAEKDGKVAAVDGVKIGDVDAAIAKYENMIRDGIDPRISVQIRGIDTPHKTTVLLIRVEQSWIKPHRVIYKKRDDFYARNSNGKYALDTQQLRDAFNHSQTAVEKLKEFRVGRIFEIAAGNVPTPFALADGLKAILHFLPLSSVCMSNCIEIAEMEESQKNLTRIMLRSAPNLDGFLQHREHKTRTETVVTRYIQMFRNGMFEAVIAPCCFSEQHSAFWTSNDNFMRDILYSFWAFLNFAKSCEVAPPVIISLTLTDAKDCEIRGTQETMPSFYFCKFDRDVLQIPEVMVDSYDVNPREILLQIFDIMWQAGGHTGTPSSEKQILLNAQI